MSTKFFKELVEFLPKHVSPTKSYIHSALTFVIVFIISKIIIKQIDMNFDVDSDGSESESEEKAKFFIECGIALLISLFASDMAFNISWGIRNRINKNHRTYQKWFKALYN